MCINNRTEEAAPKMPQKFVYSKLKERWESSRWQLRQWSCRQPDATQNQGRSPRLTAQMRGCLKTQMAPCLRTKITYKRAKMQLLGFKIENRAGGKRKDAELEGKSSKLPATWLPACSEVRRKTEAGGSTEPGPSCERGWQRGSRSCLSSGLGGIKLRVRFLHRAPWAWGWQNVS